jgi:hypothetical protein
MREPAPRTHQGHRFRWDEKAGPWAGCDTLPMRNALEVQSKGETGHEEA